VELRGRCARYEQADELEQSALNKAEASSDQLRDELGSLKSRLELTQQELEDLRSQNADLATQLAERQVVTSGSQPHGQFDHESLSWEERKALIIKQLEEDSVNAEIPDVEVQQQRLEIERIIETTQQEVEKRDREIEELRSIVEHQSDTKQGVAIGAAAIAQMLDSDELVAQERQKLKEIQQEWQEKLRQAEIDLSMERAKLARERCQLEDELANARSQQAAVQEPGGVGKTRKWLDRLGLSDDSKK
jgi:hypothetical protein